VGEHIFHPPNAVPDRIERQPPHKVGKAINRLIRSNSKELKLDYLLYRSKDPRVRTCVRYYMYLLCLEGIVRRADWSGMTQLLRAGNKDSFYRVGQQGKTAVALIAQMRRNISHIPWFFQDTTFCHRFAR